MVVGEADEQMDIVASVHIDSFPGDNFLRFWIVPHQQRHRVGTENYVSHFGNHQSKRFRQQVRSKPNDWNQLGGSWAVVVVGGE